MVTDKKRGHSFTPLELEIVMHAYGDDQIFRKKKKHRCTDKVDTTDISAQGNAQVLM